MKRSLILLLIMLACTLGFEQSYADDGAQVELFSPQGVMKGVRQVTARFSEEMVPLGDPRLTDPFTVHCLQGPQGPQAGHGRWADGRNWIYDFDNNLPAGVKCEFTLTHDLKTLSGKPLTGQQTFTFSTGGPSILKSFPNEGNNSIDEDQAFILSLDAGATQESMLANVTCSIEGINERVGVKIIEKEERERLIKHFKNMYE